MNNTRAAVNIYIFTKKKKTNLQCSPPQTSSKTSHFYSSDGVCTLTVSLSDTTVNTRNNNNSRNHKNLQVHRPLRENSWRLYTKAPPASTALGFTVLPTLSPPVCCYIAFFCFNMMPLNLWWKHFSIQLHICLFFCFFLNVCTKYLLQNLTKLLICLKNKKGFNISNDLKAPFFQSVGEHFLTIGLARTHAHTQTVKSVSAWFAFPRLFSVFHPKATSVASMSGGTAQLSSNPEDDSMAYSSLFLIRCWSQNSGSLSRFMQVLAVGRRSRSVPPLWMQKAG